ncbi:Tc toxin subunit A [Enterobacter kobei]
MEQNQLTDNEELSVLLNNAGYKTIFDIVTVGRQDFMQSLAGADAKSVRALYRQATQRAGSLRALFRSVQLRQEPVISSISKLRADMGLPALRASLERSLGGGGDFSNLLERASEYADVTSIQSLFSPGRYATALYKIAKDLYSTENDLHIDKRRADLKSLPLSEATMTQEVSSLDILLSVLQPSGDELPALSETYFPVNLPYDDNQAQINAALTAQGQTLSNIWDIMSDVTLQAMGSRLQVVSTRTPREGSYLSGSTFFLKSTEMIYLSHSTSGNNVTGAQLIQGNTDNAAEAIVAPLKLVWSGLDQCYFLGVPDDTTMAGTSGKDLTGGFLRGNSSTNASDSGSFAQIASKNSSTTPSASFHLSVTLVPEGNNYRLKTNSGYLGIQASGQSNWSNALIIDAPYTEALIVSLCKDSAGAPLDTGTSIYPEVINTQPSPPARERLSLTPAAYRLITNQSLTEEEVADCYGLSGGALRDSVVLADTLNSVPVFLEKTQLTFNTLLDLTAQHDYIKNGDESVASGIYKRFDMDEGSFINIYDYGAHYLNSALSNSTENNGKYLWVQKDGNTLNFQADSVIELAGRATKLIRLARQNVLTFEELDWLIVNVSLCIPDYDGKVILDTSVLGPLSEYTRLRERYGLEVNDFVALISSINPNARSQEKSQYETIFTSAADDTQTIPFGGNVNYLSGSGWYTSCCCEALGVTSDELARIGTYCFDTTGQFTMAQDTASQIYRFRVISRMLGLSFAQLEALWLLMGDGQSTLLKEFGRSKSLLPLDIIRRTENVLQWMADNALTVLQVQAMLSTQWNATATPEMFNALKNVYESVSETSATREGLTDAQQQKILRALSAEFKLKSNVMAQVIHWLESGTAGGSAAFTLPDYWGGINSVFSQDAPDLGTLQENEPLVIDTLRLSQRVLIAQWLTLTEQDLQLLIQQPQWLLLGDVTVRTPDLTLLLTLSRFKQWQSRVTVSRDEALRCFEQLNDPAQTPVGAAELIARLHNTDSDTVLKINTLLSGENNWPHSFDTLWQLLTWVKTGKVLNIGSNTLGDLYTMMLSDPAAEDPALLERVARNLTAGLNAASH